MVIKDSPPQQIFPNKMFKIEWILIKINTYLAFFGNEWIKEFDFINVVKLSLKTDRICHSVPDFMPEMFDYCQVFISQLSPFSAFPYKLEGLILSWDFNKKSLYSNICWIGQRNNTVILFFCTNDIIEVQYPTHRFKWYKIY